METAEHREPCESRGSRTDLGAPGGEIPPGNSTLATDIAVKEQCPLLGERRPRSFNARRRCVVLHRHKCLLDVGDRFREAVARRKQHFGSLTNCTTNTRGAFSGNDRPGRGSGVRSLVGKSSRSGKALEYEGQRSYQQDAEAHHCKAHGIKGGGSEHRDRSTLPGAHQNGKFTKYSAQRYAHAPARQPC